MRWPWQRPTTAKPAGFPSDAEIDKAASAAAESWNDDWRRYCATFQRLTGLTRREAMLFRIVSNLEGIVVALNRQAVKTGPLIDLSLKALKDEQQGDDWKPPE